MSRGNSLPFKHEQVDDRLLVLLLVLLFLFFPLLRELLLSVLDGRAHLLERELEVAVDVVAGAEDLDLGVGKIQPKVESFIIMDLSLPLLNFFWYIVRLQLINLRVF